MEPPRVERREIKPLAPAEARKLLDTVTADRLEALYSVALSIGLRRGEILGLRWEDMDLEVGTIAVKQAAQRIRGKGIIFAPPKTDRARRTIAIPAPLVSALRAHRRRQMEERLRAGCRWHTMGLVFTSNVGTPIEPRNLARHFKHLLVKAGLANMRFHDLRHSAASLLLAQNVNPRTVMDILGHSRISMTLDTYSHVMPAATREAADKISAVLWEDKRSEGR